MKNTFFYENNSIMDKIDRKILWSLQDNCRLSISDLGNLVGLSTSATHRRIGILEQEGLIEKYTATFEW